MKEHFYKLADALSDLKSSGEVLHCLYEGEESDFCRINGARIRQPGHVSQHTVTLRLIRANRQAKISFNLSGTLADDLAKGRDSLGELRQTLPHLPEDPYLLYATDVCSSEHMPKSQLSSPYEVLDDVLQDAAGHDLVGIYAAGGIFRGFANSLGQRNWFASHTFNLDASLYVGGDKAAKFGLAGFAWDREKWRAGFANARRDAKILERPAKTVSPGKYRVYLAPPALDEVFELLSWNSFGLKAQESKKSALNWLVAGREKLHASVDLQEDIAGGMSPSFDDFGFMRPKATQLIAQGRHAASLASARSAREFDVPNGGANQRESPESLVMAAGTLAEQDILQRLGTGIFINNLWYLNYSDMPACRMTGMTRFACFWVENGEIVAPLSVMRFDESLYRMLGSELEALTSSASFLPSTATYEKRSTESRRLPGALIGQFQFTL